MHNQLDTHLRIGKAGITPNVIEHVKKLLKVKKIVKIKFLPAAFHDTKRSSKRALAEQLATACNATLIEQLGGTVVLKKA